MSITEAIALIAALTIIARLLTYRRRRGARFRRGVAVAAWLLIAACAWLIMRLVTGDEPAAWWLALVLAGIAVTLLRCRGNLAHLIRIPWRP